MPQMAPIWWTSLFTTFIMSLIMIYLIMYFLFPINPMITKTSSSDQKNINWKW